MSQPQQPKGRGRIGTGMHPTPQSPAFNVGPSFSEKLHDGVTLAGNKEDGVTLVGNEGKIFFATPLYLLYVIC